MHLDGGKSEQNMEALMFKFTRLQPTTDNSNKTEITPFHILFI